MKRKKVVLAIVGVILIVAGAVPDPVPVIDEVVCYLSGATMLLKAISGLLKDV